MSEMKVNRNGDKRWYLNGQKHRTDGPAIELADGGKEWWLNGQRHRIGGPAIEWADGRKSWWLNGRAYSFEEYIAELEKQGLQDKVVDAIFHMV